MNFQRKVLFAAVIVAALTLASHAPAQDKSSDPSAASTRKITGSGCVEAGVEAGCLIVRDNASKVLYNVFFSSKNRPAIGSGIRFTGEPHSGPTTCMQGKAVDVREWAPARLKCEGRSGKVKI